MAESKIDDEIKKAYDEYLLAHGKWLALVNEKRRQDDLKSWPPGTKPLKCTWCGVVLPYPPPKHGIWDGRIGAHIGVVNGLCDNCDSKAVKAC